VSTSGPRKIRVKKGVCSGVGQKKDSEHSGLHQPNGGAGFGDAVRWGPVPVHTGPEDTGNRLRPEFRSTRWAPQTLDTSMKTGGNPGTGQHLQLINKPSKTMQNCRTRRDSCGTRGGPLGQDQSLGASGGSKLRSSEATSPSGIYGKFSRERGPSLGSPKRRPHRGFKKGREINQKNFFSQKVSHQSSVAFQDKRGLERTTFECGTSVKNDWPHLQLIF